MTFVNTFVDTLKQTNYNYIIITVCLLFSGFNSFKCVVTVSKPEVVSPSSSVSPGALNLGTYLLSVVPGEETLLTQCLLHPLHPLQPLRGTRCPLFRVTSYVTLFTSAGVMSIPNSCLGMEFLLHVRGERVVLKSSWRVKIP